MEPLPRVLPVGADLPTGLLGCYVGCSFAPNHKGMPVLPANDKTDFLRRAQPLIAAFCAAQHVPYSQTSLLESYAQALRHLNATGKLARRAPVPAITPALSPP